MPDFEPEITVAGYLFTRLYQLGLESIFGVPGDFNLKLLDHVEPNKLKWIGNCNELNAAYAADGYARIKGLSALITTFGVGELSAINGVAGAYTERSPIIHIVGTPARDVQKSRTQVHHSFDGEFRIFAAMHAHVTAAQTNVTDLRTAAKQIDWVIEQALIHSRPVYLELPDDVVNLKISAATLHRDRITRPEIPVSSHESEAIDQTMKLILASRKPCIFVDGEVRSAYIQEEVEEIVELTAWPTWTPPFGKGLVNEQLPNVMGIHEGMTAGKEAKAYFESTDLVLNFGHHLSDTNTQLFTTIPRKSVTIAFSADSVQLPERSFADISSKRVLAEVVQRLRACRSEIPSAQCPSKPNPAVKVENSGSIAQNGFWPLINPLLQAGDVVLTETGTAAHGGRQLLLPERARFFTAVTWLSIGTMLPAALGAGVAARELSQSSDKNAPSGRTILFIGDGSLQMTVQEISTIMTQKLDMVIIVLNNDGYTIERAIHGRKQRYNDVARWRNLEALNFFGGDKEGSAKSVFSARTWGELETALSSQHLKSGQGLRMLEVFMDREDCPGVLMNLLQSQIAGEEKARQLGPIDSSGLA